MIANLEDASKIHFLRLISEDVCTDARLDELDEANWLEAGIYHRGIPGEDQSRRSSNIIENNSPESLRPLFDAIREGIAPLATRDGSKIFGVSTLQLIRYRPGDRFRQHRDAEPGMSPWRRHSFVCYLNTAYEGGETCFLGLDIAITPKPGYAVLFPSTYLHEGREVLSGTKYIVIGFLIDPNTVE